MRLKMQLRMERERSAELEKRITEEAAKKEKDLSHELAKMRAKLAQSEHEV